MSVKYRHSKTVYSQNYDFNQKFYDPDFLGTCVMYVGGPYRGLYYCQCRRYRKRDRKSAISPKWKIKLRIKVDRISNIVLLRVGGKIS